MKRVKASIRRLCEGWVAGTYRGHIRRGHNPNWVRELPESPAKWELLPDRVEAVRLTTTLYMQGMGGKLIAQQLDAKGLRLCHSTAANNTTQIYRLVKMPQLAGIKPVSVDGEQHLLHGYYPSILSTAEWEELQRVGAQSGRRRVAGDLPHVITGIGITVCSYCSRPMAGQHLATKPRLPDGRIRDGYRRLLCASAAAYGSGCTVHDCLWRRAIMSYCSDIAKPASLIRRRQKRRAARPCRSAARARTGADPAVGASDRCDAGEQRRGNPDGSPAGHGKSRRLAAAGTDLATAEAELASISRKDITGADEAWRELAAGGEAQDAATRLRARQLVADTFQRIVVYHHGMRPSSTAAHMITTSTWC